MSVPLPTLAAKFEFAAYLNGISVYVISQREKSWLGVKRHPLMDAYAEIAEWTLLPHPTFGEVWIFENSVELLSWFATTAKALDVIQMALSKKYPKPSKPELPKYVQPVLKPSQEGD